MAFFDSLYQFMYVHCARLPSQLCPAEAARERCFASHVAAKQRSPSSRRADGSAMTVCLTPRLHRRSVPPHWVHLSTLYLKRINRGLSVQNKYLTGELLSWMSPQWRCVLISKFPVSTSQQDRREGAELSGHPSLE